MTTFPQERPVRSPSVTPKEILADFRIALRSRHASVLGRREVLSGRAKFGIFGDGKEVAQLAMARFFRPGDFRSGYYRDQTLMMALGEMSVQEFYAQLYAHADPHAEPASAGRQMNAHFATHSLDENGDWRDLTQQVNSSADVSPTAAQMPRLVGLAYASRLYRELDSLQDAPFRRFSRNGNEIAFGTIGNASSAEGLFWESLNAIGVLKSPAVISIYDDGYGISVPNEFQMVKGDLTALLAGFRRTPGQNDGYELFTVRGWDYVGLLAAYEEATRLAREEHIPSILHIIEVTQPQGHSTSGSHERYKSAERLEWEIEYDCLTRMRQWLIDEKLATAKELNAIDKEEARRARSEQLAAFKAYNDPINAEKQEVARVLQEMTANSTAADALDDIRRDMLRPRYAARRDIMVAIRQALVVTRHENQPARSQLIAWRDAHKPSYQALYSTHLVSESAESPLNVTPVAPVYSPDAPEIAGFSILNHYFDSAFADHPALIAFGEDLGLLGGVNQAMAGLQEKYGALRISDTGIREATIIGQAIGMAMRGLRPIAEIQYLDYILYALQIMGDDLATVRWRTAGRQKAPVIIRTRGHRLEGIWHAGSPLSSMIQLIRGIHVCVPRDMTRAVGFYNTLLQGDDPGLVVEVLNGYRRREPLPDNLSAIALPLGVPETLREGSDVTLITYGALCQIALDAAEVLAEVGVEVEVIDVQTLLPFDRHHHIVESLKKTSRLVCLDEDVPGGTTAYMLQQVLETQGGYHWLDAEPRTLAAQPHRPPYGSDGNYFGKPNREDIIETVYELMHESDPRRYPLFYR